MRTPILIVATGKQGVGKTHETLKQMLLQAYIATHRRKGLLFDTNNEFGSYKIDGKIHRIKHIQHNEIIGYGNSQNPEVRRIIPFHQNGMGRPMSPEETEKLLIRVLEEFRGGSLLIEDLNRIYGDSIPVSLSGMLCNVRHRNCDVLYHLQSVGRLLPKMRQNTSIVRYHYQLDGVDESSEKLGGEIEIFYIAEKLVNAQYDAGNKRFFVYIYRDDKKLKGEFSQKMLAVAIENYILENPSTTRALLNRRDRAGKKMYNYDEAVRLKTHELFNKYWGNVA